MQEILEYLKDKGNIDFFDWNNQDIMDFKLLVVSNFTGDENYFKSIIEINFLISYFDLTDKTIKSQIIPK
jgi:hypothetical protein